MKLRVFVVVGLAMVVIGAVATAELTEVPSTPIWLVVATAGLGLVSTLLTDVLSARLQSINDRRNALARFCYSDDAGGLPRVDRVSDLLPFGVRAPRPSEGAATNQSNTTYVPRDVDPELDRALAQGGLVIASGPSLSGRTRSMFEAIRRAYPGRVLLAPRDPTTFAELVRSGVPYRQGVVWLDRLERFTGTDGLDLYTLTRQATSRRRPGVVVGTIDVDETSVPASDLVVESLRRARTVSYSMAWSQAELSRARALAASDPSLRAALQRAGSDANLLLNLAGSGGAARFAAVDYMLPPKPVCLGRDAQVAEVAALLSSALPRPVCLLGPPGIGKATVLRAALHDQTVTRRYRQRRVFLRCETAQAAYTLVADIAVALGVTLGKDVRGRVLTELGSGPTAVVLSGVGEAWEHDTVATEELLGQLAAVPGVALAISVRGAAAPLGVAWNQTIRLRRLDHDTARRLFLSIAGDGFRGDAHLNDLVAAQDGLPLAVELLAFSAQGEPDLVGLWRRWAARRGVASSDDARGYDRFGTSLELTIESVRMNTSSLTLLSVLGALPDGIDYTDIDTLVPDTGDVAAATLRKVGLAFDEQGRLRMLKPIQEHVARTRPVAEDMRSTLEQHYITLAQSLCAAIGAANGSQAAARLVAESANIEALVRLGLASSTPSDAGRAACALAAFTRYTGLGGPELLEEAARAASRTGDTRLEAECVYHLADLDLRQSRLPRALERFRDAQALFEEFGDRRLLADTVKHIGDVLFELCDFDAASEQFVRSQALYEAMDDHRGMANSVKCLGDIAERRSDYPAAAATYHSALSTFEVLDDPLGVADCLRRLADVDLAEGRVDTALERYRNAARAYDKVGAVMGLANCQLGEANVALALGDNETALEWVQRAEPHYGRMRFVRGQARCVEMLGRLSLAGGDVAPAREHFVCAQDLFETAADVIGVADCLLGRSRAEDDPTAAANLAAQALGRYETVSRVIGIALAHEQVAATSLDPVIQIAQARAAMDAWNWMGRAEAVARVADQYPGA